MENKRNINVNINEGEEFFAHEMSVNYNPTQFIMDFRCVTPRIDIRSKKSANLSIRHNIVMVEPWHAKEIVRVMNNVIEGYEKKFGEIKKPKAIEDMQKEQKEKDEDKKTKTQAPSYMG